MSWNKFKAVRGTETLVIAGEVFEVRKSVTAKEVNDIIAKYRSDPNKIFRELLRLIIVNPAPPENDEEFDEIIEEMDAAVKAKLETLVLEKTGLKEYFRISTA